MAGNGARIMQHLICMYAELKKAGVSVRTLDPTVIYLSDDCNAMKFVDLSSITYHREKVMTKVDKPLPYSDIKWNKNKL